MLKNFSEKIALLVFNANISCAALMVALIFNCGLEKIF